MFEKTIVYGAALWAVIFGFFHFAWAAGWYVGLNTEEAQKAFQQKWFLMYDILAGVLCLFGAIIILEITVNRKQDLMQKAINWLALLGTALLVLRGGAGILKIIYLVITGNNVNQAAFWDVWFCLGAVLFCFAVWRFRLRHKKL